MDTKRIHEICKRISDLNKMSSDAKFTARSYRRDEQHWSEWRGPKPDYGELARRWEQKAQELESERSRLQVQERKLATAALGGGEDG